MAEKSFKGQCIYCLKSFDDLTSDHVFPRSWYPKTTPPEMEKWRAPACKRCNAEMGRIENRLLIQIGLCVPPFERESLGIAHKALRALKPEYARNGHDAEVREKLGRMVIEKTVDPSKMRLSSIFPQFGFHPGVDPRQELGVLVLVSDLEAIGKKIIRGTTWVINETCIDANHSIHVTFPLIPTSGAFFEDLMRFGTLFSLGPGLSIVRAPAGDDRQSGIYLIEIWGRLYMHGCVAPTQNRRE